MVLAADPRIEEALEELGIRELTQPQVRAAPAIREGKHVLLIAPTGIGKTEAVMIPILEALLAHRPPRIGCLYITPLRALNRDMLRRMAFFGEYLGLDVAVRHGDTSKAERARQSRSPPEILITTPETLQIMFTGRRLREHLRHVRWVVVDEIHELAGDERGAQLAVALERLERLADRAFQRVGLSATVGSPERVARFLGGVDREVEVVDVRSAKETELAVELPPIGPEEEALAERLTIGRRQAAALVRTRSLFESHRSTLFFVNSRDAAEFLSSRFRQWEEDLPVGVHHGSLSKQARVEAEERFKAEELRALISTSSMELGIDVGATDLVLQYNSPRQVTRLVQRVGRSGHRVGRLSKGVVVASNEEELAEAVVIARRGASEDLEPYEVRKNPLNVLANQVAAHLLTEGRGDAKAFYELVRRADPFRDLPWAVYEDVLRQLTDLRVIRYRDPSFYKAFQTLPYFYENISMIPDETTYRVQDVSSRSFVGTLDEAFVAGQLHVGTPFIMKGQSWQVVDIGEEGRIMVHPAKEMGGIPSWVGEEIPVPFGVAQEVGRLRGEGNLQGYPVNEEGRRAFEAYVQRQAPQPVPTDRLLTVEQGEDLVVVNAAFGSKVNETLGHLLSALLSARVGQSVGIRTDPYRVLLQVPAKVRAEDVADVLRGIDPETVEPTLRISLRQSTLIRWVFVQVAKKFGAMRRDVSYRNVNVGRVMKAFDHTPLMEEVMEKLIWEHLDVRRTEEVIRGIREGTLRLEVGPLSRIGRLGAERALELLLPPRPDHHTLGLLRKRLEDQRVLLACLSCKRTRTERVAALRARVTCPSCDSVMQAALRPWQRDKAALIHRKKLTPEERREVKRLYTSASLVMAHGRRAAMALVARGVGPNVAGRILRGYHDDQDDFLRDILEAEINYARTKRFWD
ncbi:MAG: DEAD/DEAH box helicase [Thermoplasmata archaeon]